MENEKVFSCNSKIAFSLHKDNKSTQFQSELKTSLFSLSFHITAKLTVPVWCGTRILIQISISVSECSEYILLSKISYISNINIVIIININNTFKRFSRDIFVFYCFQHGGNEGNDIQSTGLI